jgi:L-glyceraldehyde reductase
MHWPVAFEHTNETLTPIDPVTKHFRLADVPVAATWAALEKLVKKGKIRSIGVSNFSLAHMRELLQTAEIPPACNQIEAHPYLQQPELFRFLKENVCGLQKSVSRFGNRLTRYIEYPSCRLQPTGK